MQLPKCELEVTSTAMMPEASYATNQLLQKKKKYELFLYQGILLTINFSILLNTLFRSVLKEFT